jgi:hypothetical protein
MLLATEPVKAKCNRESHFEETNHPLPCVHSALHFQAGTEAARGAEGAPAPPTACVIKEFFFSFP